MSIHEIQAPDGSVHQIEAPDNASPDQVMSFFQQGYQPQGNLTAGLINQAKQGATFGFGDELSAGFAAPAEYLGNVIGRNINPNAQSNSLSDYYNRDLQNERNTLNYAQQQAPLGSAAANIAGALMTGGLGAGSKGAAAITDSLGSGNLPARIAKSAGYGLASGALYGFGAGQDNVSNRLQTAKDYADVGGVLGAAAPAAIAATGGALKGIGTIAKGISLKPDELSQIASDIKDNAVGLRTQANLSSVVLNPSKSGELSDNIDQAMSKLEMIPELSPRTNIVVNKIKDAAAQGNLNLNQLDQYGRMLGNTQGEDYAAASAVRGAIKNTINSIAPEDLASGSPESVDLLNQFKKGYSQGSKYQDISDIVTKANGNTNQLKNGLSKFLANDDNTKGWNDTELQALQTAANSSTSDKILKALGTFGFDFGKAKNVALPTITSMGAFGAPTMAAPLVVAGTAARQAGKYLTQGKVADLLNTISPAEISQLPPSRAMELLNNLKQLRIKVQ